MEGKPIDRILLFIRYIIYEQIITSEAEFERKCGFYVGYLFNQKRGKGFMNGESLITISLAYPELNLDWVITGRGYMFYQGYSRKNIKRKTKKLLFE